MAQPHASQQQTGHTGSGPVVYRYFMCHEDSGLITIDGKTYMHMGPNGPLQFIPGLIPLEGQNVQASQAIPLYSNPISHLVAYSFISLLFLFHTYHNSIILGPGHPGYVPPPQPVYIPPLGPSQYQDASQGPNFPGFGGLNPYPALGPNGAFGGVPPAPRGGPTMSGALPPQPPFGPTGPFQDDTLHQQLQTAQNPALKMNEGQEMQPADPDKLRVYWVRELDDTWTQRNRATIDSGDLGRIKWYSMSPGIFYAVIQRN
ncbi:hypothetical protein BP6252_12662 [Coleophoma cylindrospora]|uniref:Uncharacterized protein n=1 Tax=Coleophoma cylindrospora TaxID=1849047 RepID=A0A3D8QCJ2_9HELO|nr:hypothetical protein BP6252_12662 [Coleophoma cylindrospora]